MLVTNILLGIVIVVLLAILYRLSDMYYADEPDDSPDDAPLAVVEGPDDSNRSIYTPVTQTVDNVNHPQHYKHGCTAGNLRRTYS